MSFVTVQSQILTPQWLHGESTLKIFSSAPFFEFTTGLYVGEGNLQNINSFCQSIACTLDGTVLTLPQITLATTIDSSVPTALMSAGIYDSNNVLQYTMLDQFFVDPYYFQSPAQASVTVASAGSTVVIGNYTYRGLHGNRPYYNLEGQADSTSLYAVFWDGAQWNISNSAGAIFYIGTNADFPWDAVWSVSAGVAPAPNVNENQELVVATWEQLTISNQGTGTVYPFGLPGPFWNVEQTKQYINGLVGDGTTPFANTLVVGKTALDTTPEISTFPIAVATNSERINRVLSEDYNNNLATAIAAFGSSVGTLIIKEDVSGSAAYVIPETMFLDFQNGAVITKVSGTIEFEGLGLVNPLSTVPVFAGYAAGNVTWTGDLPQAVSSELLDPGTDSLSTRVAFLEAAFGEKIGQLVCYPRTITAAKTLTKFYEVLFTPGEYLNTRADNQAWYAFGIGDNTTVVGYGATLYESNVNSMGAMFFVGTGNAPDPSELHENVYFYGLRFKSNGASNVAGFASTIALNNTHNGGIFNCQFDQTQYYNTLGGNGSDGNYGLNLTIQNCFFNGVDTQAVALLNGKNLTIRNNTFYYPNNDATFSPIDVEPNLDVDILENILIEGNRIISTDPNGFSGVIYAIAVQCTLSGSIKQVVICNNEIIGATIIPAPANLSPVANGISILGVTGFQCYDNHMRSAYQIGSMQITLCTDGAIYDNTGLQCSSADATIPGGLWMRGVANSDVYNNTFNVTPNAGLSQKTNIIETEYDFVVTTTGSTVTNLRLTSFLFFDFFAGLSVTINATDYVIDEFIYQTTLTTTVPVGTHTPQTFTSADVTTGTGNIAITGHGYITGAKVYPTTAGTLPVNAGLVATTPVFIIRVDNNNIKLATTLANANANTPMTYSGAGSGTSTLRSVLTTKFSSNTYQGNKADDGITLESTGTSLILGDYRRDISDWIAPTQITSNQNNYNPGRSAYRLDLTTDASRNLTGLVFMSPPQLNGEKHWIRNLGSFSLVLVHQSASSTVTNRFFCNTGANITLLPNESAHIEYDTNGFWWVTQDLGVISTGDLPTSIPAPNIADGSVSNAEFQRLDGVTSGIQGQIDLKSPLISPSFTTPVLGVATGTSLTTTGLLKSSGTAGIGYATGAGGAQTQATSKVTAFTLSKTCGQITFAADQLDAGETNSAVWTNTTIAATDVVVFNHVSGGTIGAYDFNAQCGVGSATINITNRTAGNLSESPVVTFAVIKAVTA